jgi:hypothetical protein
MTILKGKYYYWFHFIDIPAAGALGMPPETAPPQDSPKATCLLRSHQPLTGVSVRSTNSIVWQVCLPSPTWFCNPTSPNFTSLAIKLEVHSYCRFVIICLAFEELSDPGINLHAREVKERQFSPFLI